jgi:hypothetical protein
LVFCGRDQKLSVQKYDSPEIHDLQFRQRVQS